MLSRHKTRLIFLNVAILGVTLILTLACERGRKPTEPDRVWTPSVRDLHNSYVDGSDRYTGKTIRVDLPAFSYLVADGALHWHGNNPKSPPDIVFTVRRAPDDNTKAVTVEGVCHGRVEYKPWRPPGPKFYVSVEVLHVTPH